MTQPMPSREQPAEGEKPPLWLSLLGALGAANPGEFARQALVRAGMRPDVDAELVVVAAKRCAVATLDRARGLELGAVTRSREAIAEHPRLLRSLCFGDDDYDGCVLDVVRQLLLVDSAFGRLERIPAIAEFLDLRAWLALHDPTLHRQLYDDPAPAPLEPADLAALARPEVVVEHLARLQRAADAGRQRGGNRRRQGAHRSRRGPRPPPARRESSIGADFPALCVAAQRALGLHPAQIAGAGPGAAATRRILGGLTTVAIGVAELRNDVGTGHGRAQPGQATRDQALLAVEVAGVYVRALLRALTARGMA